MTDITKCSGADCDLKLTCYRYTAPASTWQSYYIKPPTENGKCDSYWETFNTKEE